jgi:methanogenic corrinoid protein MtbC1
VTGTAECWSRQVEEYLGALERGDRSSALGQVRRLLEAGEDAIAVMERLLAPAQLRIGELWASDAWSVAQEHAATAVSESVIASLGLERESRRASAADAAAVVVGCVEQEWHALPALLVAERLRADGFAVTYLGANASAPALVRHVHETSPAAVLLSCSLATFLPLVRRQVEAVRETGTPVVVGGAAFGGRPRRAAMLGASGYAATAAEVAPLLRSLPASATRAAPLRHPGVEEAFAVFAEREDLAEGVERLVLRDLLGPDREHEGEHLEPRPAWRLALTDQLPHVVGSVAGALVCDDPQPAREALTWAETVLAHRGAPVRFGPALRRALAAQLRELPVATRLLGGTS